MAFLALRHTLLSVQSVVYKRLFLYADLPILCQTFFPFEMLQN
jgi:hypothetical protein